MVRIGILGGENSHADCFAKYFNFPDEDGKPNVPGFRVTAVAGNYPDANRKLADYYGLELVAERPEELLGKVDAVMVTARDGKYHASFAEPFVRAGLPVFIDKPFTTDYEAAKKLARLAEECGAPILGGSSVKLSGDVKILANLVKSQGDKIHGGSVTAPLAITSEHSGFWFYASHLVEVALAIFGRKVKSVYAVRTANDVTAMIEYAGFAVSYHFADECYSSYLATVIAKDRSFTREIDFSLCFNEECDLFSEMVRTGVSPESSESLTYPVLIMQSIIRSYETGTRVTICE